VSIDFLVNPQTIAGEETSDGGRHYVIEFHVAAYSSASKLISHKDAAIDAPIKHDRLQALMQQGIPFKTDLDLGAGQYTFRLVVREGRTGYTGSSEMALTLSGK
jgi:hypothetical protein